MRLFSKWGVGLAVMLAAVIGGCSEAEKTPAAPEVFEAKRTPVILISCDTLRADHLGAYGHTRDTTPNLDRWAREEAVLFETAVTPSTWTLPAHMSMLTGLYPIHHKTTEFANLPESIKTLPELLQDQGYKNAGFTGHNWWLLPSRGFSRGFEVYDVPEEGFRHVNEVLALTQKWIQQRTADPFFLFFHNYDAHGKLKSDSGALPYDAADPGFYPFSSDFGEELEGIEGQDPRSGFTFLEAYRAGAFTLAPRQHEYLAALYDDCVRMLDQRIADLFDTLKEAGVYDDALIIVTSDHGESLNEHGYYGHYFVYEPECLVPLLIKFPGGAFGGTRFKEPVSLVDLVPTVLDVLDMPLSIETDGLSLRQLLRKEASPARFQFVERERKRAIRTDEWKLHWIHLPEGNDYKLFDLARDPGENENLADKSIHQLVPLLGELQEFFKLDLSGWHFEVLADDDAWRPELRVSTDARITDFLKIDPKQYAEPLDPDSPNSLQLPVDDPLWRHFALRVVPSGSTLHLNCFSERPFTLVAGGAAIEVSARLERDLDPADPAYASPGTTSEVHAPALLVWYEAPGVRQDAAPAPDADMEEALRALGYLGE